MHIFVESGSIYIKPRPKRSSTHSKYSVENISPAEML